MAIEHARRNFADECGLNTRAFCNKLLTFWCIHVSSAVWQIQSREAPSELESLSFFSTSERLQTSKQVVLSVKLDEYAKT